MKNKIFYFLSLLLVFTLSGCKEKETLILNEKYSKYYDVENNIVQKGILIEYGNLPIMEIGEYLSENQSDEYLQNTTITLHNMKEEQLIEEPIELKETLEIGDYYLLLANDEDKIQLLISVRDTIAPEFVKFTDTVEFQQGDKVDLTQLVHVSDLSNVNITVDGGVDFNKPGEYKVTFTATDESNNKTSKECTIIIHKKPEPVKPTISKPETNNTNQSTNNKDSNENIEKEEEEIVIPESSYITQYNQQVFDLINAKRAEINVSPLTYNSSLQSIANERAKEIVEDFSHAGLKKYEQANNCDYGEIIAYGYGTPSDVIQGWMNSTGHKNAMLAYYQITATVSAYYDGFNNSTYWVVIFTH